MDFHNGGFTLSDSKGRVSGILQSIDGYEKPKVSRYSYFNEKSRHEMQKRNSQSFVFNSFHRSSKSYPELTNS